VRAKVRTCVPACVRACKHTLVRAYVRTCARTCVRACTHAHVRVCMRVFVRACVRACVCTCVVSRPSYSWFAVRRCRSSSVVYSRLWSGLPVFAVRRLRSLFPVVGVNHPSSDVLVVVLNVRLAVDASICLL